MKTLLQTLVPDPKEERVVIKSVAFRKVYPVVPPPLSPPTPPSPLTTEVTFSCHNGSGSGTESCMKTLQSLAIDPKEERVVIISVAFRNVYPVVTTAQDGELQEDVTDFGSRPQRGMGSD